MTPAYREGRSTSDLAVSISTRVSFTSTVSPTVTCHLTISASVSPSPTSGKVNWWASAIVVLQRFGRRCSVLIRGLDRIEYTVEIGQVVLLGARRGIRDVPAADALHGSFELGEALLGDRRHDFG